MPPELLSTMRDTSMLALYLFAFNLQSVVYLFMLWFRGAAHPVLLSFYPRRWANHRVKVRLRVSGMRQWMSDPAQKHGTYVPCYTRADETSRSVS